MGKYNYVEVTTNYGEVNTNYREVNAYYGQVTINYRATNCAISECRYFVIYNQINTVIINTRCLLKSKLLQYQLDCRLYDGTSKQIKLPNNLFTCMIHLPQAVSSLNNLLRFYHENNTRCSFRNAV